MTDNATPEPEATQLETESDKRAPGATVLEVRDLSVDFGVV